MHKPALPQALQDISKAKPAASPSRRTYQALLLLLLLLLGTTAMPSLEAQAHHKQPTVSLLIESETPIPDGAAIPRKGAKIKMTLRDAPETRISGKVLWFNLDTIAYTDSKTKATSEVAWSDLAPKRLPAFLNGLPNRKDVDSLLTVAELMIGAGMPEKRIEGLFKGALRVDQNASERIEALRIKLKQIKDAEAEPNDPKEPADGPNEQDPSTTPENNNPRAWPKMTEAQHAEAVKQLQAFTDDVLQKMNHKMINTQTERFLVYSDMPTKDTKYWVGLLDKMYDKLCETFDLDKEKNIWKGKCLLLFFNSQQDYLKYNAAAYGNSASGSAGICYQFGRGDVHIAMWRQKQKLELAHTLVHEAVHGFLFRYQSSRHVPNWLNEGLAEFISVKLVDAPSYPGRALYARKYVKQAGGLGNFLSARNIRGEHYGLAYDVTDLMVSENRKGYVKMIQGIKKGLSVEEAFEQEYGASLERVFEYYGKSRLKMDNLRI